MTSQAVAIDYPSIQGQFGWEKVGSEDLAIPVIVRSNNVRYAPVKIVETEIIKKYDAIPQAVFQCITLKSFYLTLSETKLLTNINFFHCNSRYGDEFFRTSDVIISAPDVINLSRFLNISNIIFTSGCSSVNPKFGIKKLSISATDPHAGTLLIPYIGKRYPPDSNQTTLFVPTKLIEPYVVITNTTIRAQTTDWDIMYLKMLAVYCENSSQQYINRDSGILSLDGLLYSQTNSPLIHSEYNRPEHQLQQTQAQQIQPTSW